MNEERATLLGLTKKREVELIKAYPDGKSIGRAFAEHFLEQQKSSRNLEHGFALNEMDMQFMRERVANFPREEQVDYNSYVFFGEAMAEMINIITMYSQTFEHGFYRLSYLIKSVVYCLKSVPLACDAHPDLLEGFSTAANELISVMESELMPSWNKLVCESIKVLSGLDSVLYVYGDLMKFDLSALRPEMGRYQYEYGVIVDFSKEALIAIEMCRNASDKLSTEIKVEDGAMKALRQISMASLEDVKLGDDVLNTLNEEIRSATVINRDLSDSALEFLRSAC